MVFHACIPGTNSSASHVDALQIALKAEILLRTTAEEGRAGCLDFGALSKLIDIADILSRRTAEGLTWGKLFPANLTGLSFHTSLTARSQWEKRSEKCTLPAMLVVFTRLKCVFLDYEVSPEQDPGFWNQNSSKKMSKDAQIVSFSQCD